MKNTNLASRLLNQPLAISQSYVDVLNSRISNGTIGSFIAQGIEDTTSTPETTTATIKVFDGLAAKDSWGSSYESITNQINYLASNGVSKINFYIDSPGGEVAGLFGLSNFIASLPEKYGIETVAITDGMMTSAAYILGAACQTVFATESSIIGSIGVIMTLVNVAEAEKAAGIEYTILRSKSEKALSNPHEPTSDTVISDAEKMLATLDTIMNTSVTSYRPKVSLDTIISLKGNTVLAVEALSLGLIDRIVSSFDEAISLTAPATQLSTTKDVTMSMTLEQALIKLNAAESELQTLKASSSLEVAKAKQQEQGRVLGILEAASTFKLSTDLAMKRIKANSSIDDAVEMFESIKEALQGSTFVDTSLATLTSTTPATPATPTPTQEDSFLTSFMSGIDKVVASDNLYKGVK